MWMRTTAALVGSGAILTFIGLKALVYALHQEFLTRAPEGMSLDPRIAASLIERAVLAELGAYAALFVFAICAVTFLIATLKGRRHKKHGQAVDSSKEMFVNGVSESS